eukprot:g7081.t1
MHVSPAPFPPPLVGAPLIGAPQLTLGDVDYKNDKQRIFGGIYLFEHRGDVINRQRQGNMEKVTTRNSTSRSASVGRLGRSMWRGNGAGGGPDGASTVTSIKLSLKPPSASSRTNSKPKTALREDEQSQAARPLSGQEEEFENLQRQQASQRDFLYYNDGEQDEAPPSPRDVLLGKVSLSTLEAQVSLSTLEDIRNRDGPGLPETFRGRTDKMAQPRVHKTPDLERMQELRGHKDKRRGGLSTTGAVDHVVRDISQAHARDLDHSLPVLEATADGDRLRAHEHADAARLREIRRRKLAEREKRAKEQGAQNENTGGGSKNSAARPVGAAMRAEGSARHTHGHENEHPVIEHSHDDFHAPAQVEDLPQTTEDDDLDGHSDNSVEREMERKAAQLEAEIEFHQQEESLEKQRRHEGSAGGSMQLEGGTSGLESFSQARRASSLALEGERKSKASTLDGITIAVVRPDGSAADVVSPSSNGGMRPTLSKMEQERSMRQSAMREPGQELEGARASSRKSGSRAAARASRVSDRSSHRSRSERSPSIVPGDLGANQMTPPARSSQIGGVLDASRHKDEVSPVGRGDAYSSGFPGNSHPSGQESRVSASIQAQKQQFAAQLAAVQREEQRLLERINRKKAARRMQETDYKRTNAPTAEDALGTAMATQQTRFNDEIEAAKAEERKLLERTARKKAERDEAVPRREAAARATGGGGTRKTNGVFGVLAGRNDETPFEDLRSDASLSHTHRVCYNKARQKNGYVTKRYLGRIHTGKTKPSTKNKTGRTAIQQAMSGNIRLMGLARAFQKCKIWRKKKERARDAKKVIKKHHLREKLWSRRNDIELGKMLDLRYAARAILLRERHAKATGSNAPKQDSY